MPNPNQDIRQYLREARHTPDGFTTLILSILFLVIGLVPGAITLLGNSFNFSLKPSSAPWTFLLVPLMLFVSYVWLNAFSKTSKVGAYINALMLVVFAALLFRGAVVFS